MKPNTKEVQRRTAAALAAIRRTLERGEGEFSVSLFVSHHLDELDPAYWKKHAGTPRPSPAKVLDLLVLRSPVDEEDDLDMFDFTLPDEVTDYVISVRFDDNGQVGAIEMES